MTDDLEILEKLKVATTTQLFNAVIGSVHNPVANLETAARVYNKIHSRIGKFDEVGLRSGLRVMNIILYNYSEPGLKPLFDNMCKRLKIGVIEV